jgi:hypothetical protein
MLLLSVEVDLKTQAEQASSKSLLLVVTARGASR